MMKDADPMKLERDAAEGLAALINHIPFAEVEHTQFESAGPDRGIDFILDIRANGEPYKLIAEVKTSGQPRRVREAITQLRNFIVHQPNAVPIFISPYLSEEAQRICRENDINFYDLEGNCLLVLANFYIERSVATKPAAERRELKSLFKPKSARVLRLLLREPGRVYRLSEIAELTGVSIGQVHNVKEALLAREWAASNSDGLALTKRDAMLDAWKANYEPPLGKRYEFYSTLHGGPLEEAIREALATANEDGKAALASYSAANWLAPYGRNETVFLYANPTALDVLKDKLRLGLISRGANVVVTVVNDEGIFLDAVEPARGVTTTSPVQTYLDLANSGERGVEAAEHLREKELAWPR